MTTNRGNVEGNNWEFSKPLFVSQFSAGTGTHHSGRIFSDREESCNYPNDCLGVIYILFAIVQFPPVQTYTDGDFYENSGIH